MRNFGRTRFVERRRSGATLLEALIVMGILAALAGIIMPAFHQAREMARSTVCLSNLRQMANAALAYVGANEGRYPLAYAYGGDEGQALTLCWDITTVQGPGASSSVVPGLLWQGQEIEQIQRCPSFDGPANWLADPYTGYNYNTSYVGHGQYESVSAPAQTGAITHPQTTALFGDGQWAGGANKFMRAPYPNPGDATFSGRWAGTQGYRHLGATNVAFCDGHAESLAAAFTANADGADNVAPGSGFLSPDNHLYGGP